MVCTFFGHRNTEDKLEPKIKSAIIDLIEHKNVVLFYVGNNGHFDSIVRKILRELKNLIRILIILLF